MGLFGRAYFGGSRIMAFSFGTVEPPHMPKHLLEEYKRIQTFQDKCADKITAFSGSMAFVYLHAVIFAVWIVVNLISDKRGFDPFPFGLLTLIVSLEAIFLSTFVM